MTEGSSERAEVPMESTSTAGAPKETTEKGEGDSKKPEKPKETGEKPKETREKPKETKPSNLITSLEEWRSRGKHASTGTE